MKTKMDPDPTIILIAGPNGAGKTTFAREFLPQEANCLTVINADLIAQGISPFRPGEAAVRAARLMLELIAECVERRESFAIETTLSGRTYARMIPQWKQAGYQVLCSFSNCQVKIWPWRGLRIAWPKAGTTSPNP